MLEPKNRHKEQCHRLLHAHGHGQGHQTPHMHTATSGTQGSHAGWGLCPYTCGPGSPQRGSALTLLQTALVLSMCPLAWQASWAWLQLHVPRTGVQYREPACCPRDVPAGPQDNALLGGKGSSTHSNSPWTGASLSVALKL